MFLVRHLECHYNKKRKGGDVVKTHITEPRIYITILSDMTLSVSSGRT